MKNPYNKAKPEPLNKLKTFEEFDNSKRYCVEGGGGLFPPCCTGANKPALPKAKFKSNVKLELLIRN
jgi:hypothetical protein